MGIINNIWKVLTGNRNTYTTNTSPFNISQWQYKKFGEDAYKLDAIKSSIDALARNLAKMELKHIRTDKDGNKSTVRNSDISRVLKKPNQYITSYDFLYKVATQYYLYNNAFIYPEFDEMGKLVNLYPINSKAYKIYEYKNNVYIKFTIKYTLEFTAPYSDIIHLRRFYSDDDLLGDSNEALFPAIELANATNQGIINGIANSAVIRGILKTVNILKEEDLKKNKEKFIKENLQASNNGGVIFVDGKFDYQAIDSKPYIVSAEIVDSAKSKIYDYFGVNEEFVQNRFTGEGYDAIFEGILEPFSVMIAQAFSRVLFTEFEKSNGNDIEIAMSRLKYQPIDKITSIVTATYQLGLFTVNEYREMYGYTPVEDGDKRLVSLNLVNSNKQDEYQLGE